MTTLELLVARGKGQLGSLGSTCTHNAIFKMDSYKDLLYSTWNSLNVMWQPGWEGSLGENGYISMYG